MAVAPCFGASVITDTEIQKVVGDLISPLLVAADMSPSRTKIHIVADDTFNAFVMGGEDVYIYTGLLTRIQTPNALRAVVAHELGHTLGGHMAQMSDRMAIEMKRAMIIQALGVGLMLTGGNASLGAGMVAGAGGVAHQSLLSFSRDEERIADNMGVDLMLRANQNPDGFLEVFTQMNEMSEHIESKINPNSINHPLTSERLNNVRQKLAKINVKKMPHDGQKTIYEYNMVRAKLVGYLDTEERVRALYPSSDKSDAAIYARAIANMQRGNLSGASVGTKTLISRHPKNPYFYELLGDIKYKYGHFDDSVIAYEQALKLVATAPQIESALALVLNERNKPGDKERAIELCKHSLLMEPEPMAYWVMALAYGDDARADWALAEYYMMQKQPAKAKKHARTAKSNLKPNSPEHIKANDILNNN